MIKQKCCPECGDKLIEKELEGEGLIPFCQKCNEFRFPMFNVAVSMIVDNESNGKILLIKQYGRDRNILVAGYLSLGESEEHAAIREVKEETGLIVDRLKFNRTKYFEPSNTLMCNFTAFVKDDSLMNPNKEIDTYAWFTKEEAKENIAHGSLAEEFLLKYLEEV